MARFGRVSLCSIRKYRRNTGFSVVR